MLSVNWQQLAQIGELEEYFAADSEGFQREIEQKTQYLQTIEASELDKLALLRMIEVTNGCTQYAFRRQDENCLSIDQTRACMQKVIGFMNTQTIEFPSGELIQFSPAIRSLLDSSRILYRQAFKENLAGADREFYAYSTAHFLAYGRQRLESAKQRVQQEFESLFTPYYIDRGYTYVSRYMAALVPEIL